MANTCRRILKLLDSFFCELENDERIVIQRFNSFFVQFVLIINQLPKDVNQYLMRLLQLLLLALLLIQFLELLPVMEHDSNRLLEIFQVVEVQKAAIPFSAVLLFVVHLVEFHEDELRVLEAEPTWWLIDPQLLHTVHHLINRSVYRGGVVGLEILFGPHKIGVLVGTKKNHTDDNSFNFDGGGFKQLLCF